MDEGARTVRDRHRALDGRLDRAGSSHAPSGSARRLVKVFAEHTLPTDADRFYACHPMELDGDESEGAAYSPVVDTGTTLYVAVLGQAPVLNDFLIAASVGGRWVAQPTSISSALECAPCNLPADNLKLSWSAHPAGGATLDSGTATLTFGGTSLGVSTWTTGCQAMPNSLAAGHFGGFKCLISCSDATTTTFTFNFYFGTTCTGGILGTSVFDYPGGPFASSHTCTPLNLVFLLGANYTMTITPP